MKTIMVGFACLVYVLWVASKNHPVAAPNVVTADVQDNLKDGLPLSTDLPPSTDSEVVEETVSKSNCQCAVFDTESPTEADSPILVQTPIAVSCDSEGKENCRKLCSTLAKAAGERGPQLLCSLLGHYNQLRASVHVRICDDTNWIYTGLTSPEPICCHHNEVVDCQELDNQTVN